MNNKRMQLANAKQLSKSDMKQIKAGLSPRATCNCNSNDDCGGGTPVCGNGCGGALNPPKSFHGNCDIQ